MQKLKHVPRSAAIALITLYQKTLSPDHGMLRAFFPHGCCTYDETCSDYAKRMMREYGLLHGTVKSIARILTCNPWRTPDLAMVRAMERWK